MDDLSIGESGELKFPTIVLLSVSSFRSVSSFYIFRFSYVGCINSYKCYLASFVFFSQRKLFYM